MLNQKIIDELERLINIAHEQGGKLNANLIYIAVNSEKIEQQDLVNYLLERNVEIVYDDVEPDNPNAGEVNDDVRPFDPTKIDITMKPMTLDLLLKRIKNSELDFNTAFQRKAGLWSDVQKSLLIESILLKIPLPAFYFDASNEDKWIIIDGLQRTTALKEFIVDKTLKLKGMEFFKDLNKLDYDKLPRSFQRRIDETQINIYIVNPATPENVKFNIFKRINTGGLALEPQEIRNALYQGHATKFIKELAEESMFLEATGGSIRTERMLDREFILRFVAFCYLEISTYNGNIDDFLNQAMVFLNQITDDMRHDIKEKFLYVMESCHNIFGYYTFRKMGTDGRRRPVNKVIFEAWCREISALDSSEVNILIRHKERLKKSFIKFCGADTFLNALKGSDKTSLQIRIKCIQALIHNILNNEQENENVG
jgi:hypothetical protein